MRYKIILRVIFGIFLAAPLVGAFIGTFIGTLSFASLSYNEKGFKWVYALAIGAMHGIPIGAIAGILLSMTVAWSLREESCWRVLIFICGPVLGFSLIGVVTSWIVGPQALLIVFCPIILGIVGFFIGFVLLKEYRNESKLLEKQNYP